MINNQYLNQIGKKLQESPQDDYFSRLNAKLTMSTEKQGYLNRLTTKLTGITEETPFETFSVLPFLAEDDKNNK